MDPPVINIAGGCRLASCEFSAYGYSKIAIADHLPELTEAIKSQLSIDHHSRR